MLVIDLPLFLASTCSISSFYLVAQRELRPKTWRRTFLYMPFVMATGIGISVRNAQAVIEALLGKKGVCPHTQIQYRRQAGHVRGKSYRNKAGWMPYAEILLGLYFSSTVIYAILNENYATVPFLLLFIWATCTPAACPSPNVLRASPLRRQRTGNASRHLRRPGILIFFPATHGQD